MIKVNTSFKLSRKVDVLNRLAVNTESNLLVINASGSSENEHIGEPKLIPTKSKQTSLTDGILEFNFVIQGEESRSKKKLAWDISVVYRMDILPKGIKAIKVNAAQNADIAILLN
ncbi:MAG: hypothetical protein DRI89_14260 [Bacteroidetes bacterium]|nr:MAG: hypothetical protein DRI89_14260 [Bacteroidota bacterium]